MAAQCNINERRFFVRLFIGVSAQFRVQTHQDVTFENLRNYFNGFSIDEKDDVVKFLDDAQAMGCTLLDYRKKLKSLNRNMHVSPIFFKETKKEPAQAGFYSFIKDLHELLLSKFHQFHYLFLFLNHLQSYDFRK